MRPRVDILTRIARSIFKDSRGCWLWNLRKARGGYGQIKFKGKSVPAHRVAYEAFRGTIPVGLTLDHLCRVRACVNPDHLEPVTIKVNTLRGNGPSARNAQKQFCKNGHQFSSENTEMRADGSGRACIKCRRAKKRRYDARQKNKGANYEIQAN